MSSRVAKVSVCTITYNQERFIAQAIESVMTQETDFDWEMVIGEDCSTDRTREICLAYRDKYPDKIRLLLPEKNLGRAGKFNFVQTFYACQGQYVALLEGDDFWTSPHKLQKQVDFLDSHPDYAICFARALARADDGGCDAFFIPPPQLEKGTYAIDDLLRGNFIAACSVMFRNHLFKVFPDWFFALSVGDWPLHIMNAQHGKIGYIPELMANYRIHSASFHSMMPYHKRLALQLGVYNAMQGYLEDKYQALVTEGLALTHRYLSAEHIRLGDSRNAQRHAVEAMRILRRLSAESLQRNDLIDAGRLADLAVNTLCSIAADCWQRGDAAGASWFATEASITQQTLALAYLGQGDSVNAERRTIVALDLLHSVSSTYMPQGNASRARIESVAATEALLRASADCLRRGDNTNAERHALRALKTVRGNLPLTLYYAARRAATDALKTLAGAICLSRRRPGRKAD